MKQSIKRIFHPVAKEFRTSKCSFDHNPADDFVRSQWQKQTRSIPYVMYRWSVAIFFLVIFLVSIAQAWLGGKFFIYFTNWGLTMCTLTNLFGGIILTLWYFHPKYLDKLENFTYDKPMPLSFKIYWGLHTTTLTISLVITFIYWIFLYPLYIESIPVNALNIFAHAFNSILMVADIIIVAFPIRILHIFLPVLFTFGFLIFSIIYYYAGGTDPRGNRFIYPILDWSKPGIALGTSGGVLVLFCIIAFAIFSIYKLRVVIHRRIFSHTKVELPPSTPPPYFDRTISGGIDDRLRTNGFVPTTTL